MIKYTILINVEKSLGYIMLLSKSSRSSIIVEGLLKPKASCLFLDSKHIAQYLNDMAVIVEHCVFQEA